MIESPRLTEISNPALEILRHKLQPNRVPTPIVVGLILPRESDKIVTVRQQGMTLLPDVRIDRAVSEIKLFEDRVTPDNRIEKLVLKAIGRRFQERFGIITDADRKLLPVRTQFPVMPFNPNEVFDYFAVDATLANPDYVLAPPRNSHEHEFTLMDPEQARELMLAQADNRGTNSDRSAIGAQLLSDDMLNTILES